MVVNKKEDLLARFTELRNKLGSRIESDNVIRDFVDQADEMIRELEKERLFLTTLFENGPAAIVISDLDHRLARVNREFTHLFQYTPQEAIGNTIDDLIAPPQSYSNKVSA